jgi:hypothetical protein
MGNSGDLWFLVVRVLPRLLFSEDVIGPCRHARLAVGGVPGDRVRGGSEATGHQRAERVPAPGVIGTVLVLVFARG